MKRSQIIKKTFSYLTVFIAGIMLGSIVVAWAAHAIIQRTTEGTIHSHLSGIERMEKTDYVIDKKALLREAEAGLQLLGYQLDDILSSCTERTEKLLRRASKYVDNDKIPHCD